MIRNHLARQHPKLPASTIHLHHNGAQHHNMIKFIFIFYAFTEEDDSKQMFYPPAIAILIPGMIPYIEDHQSCNVLLFMDVPSKIMKDKTIQYARQHPLPINIHT